MSSAHLSPSFPPKPSGFQGLGSSGRLVIENSEGKTEEGFDFLEQLCVMLEAAEHPATVHGDWLVLAGSGLYVRPELFEVGPQDGGGVRSSTVIAVAHPDQIPNGVFEFQHSLGENLQASSLSGFESWLSLDLPPLLAAVEGTSGLNEMIMEFPEPAPLRRRIVLGGVLQRAAHPATGPEAHPFCPCCLLTNCLDAFSAEISRDAFLGIRLLAARDQDGQVSADCRINGLDFQAGHAALLDYARTWPDRGFEMRKQYVVVHTFNEAVLQ